MTTTFTPSPAQAAYFDWIDTGTGSAVLEAVAGAGKTTTIINGLQYMTGQVIFLAYNTAAAADLYARIPADRRGAFAKTFHSVGVNALRYAFGNSHALKVDGNKTAKITKALLLERSKPELLDLTAAVAAFVGMAKQRGIGALTALDDDNAWLAMVDHFALDDSLPDGFEGYVLTTIKLAQEVLRRSNADLETIDFDDMVYLPLQRRLRLLQHDWVVIDEAQDTNPTRRALAGALLRPGGRLVAVGDRCQPAGTQVMVNRRSGNRWAPRMSEGVAIETLKPGDSLIGYTPSDCAFYQDRKVQAVKSRPYSGDLIVATVGDKVSRYTPNHHCFTNFAPLRNHTAVYLMRCGSRFRIGRARMDYASASGPIARARAEKADALWILGAWPTVAEAAVHEVLAQVRFGLPDVTFEPQTCPTRRTIGFGPEMLAECWEGMADLGLAVRAELCLSHYGRAMAYPIWVPGEYASFKRPMTVRAVNLLDGAHMLPFEDRLHVGKKDWEPVSLRREHYEGPVYNLDVSHDRLYVADGIVTHNCQAIYGFTGTDNDSLEQLEEAFGCERLPLTVSYRCPKAVVAEARKYAPHIEAADTAADGYVGRYGFDDIIGAVEVGDAILCRFNKYLVALAFKLIRSGVPAKIEGRDVGNGLVKLATRWKRVKTLTALEDKLEDYLDAERVKAKAKDDARRAQDAEDRVETLRVLMERTREQGGDTVEALVSVIGGLFEDKVGEVTPCVILCSGHKSKGREWDRVHLLGLEELQPGRTSRDWQAKQEVNLMYVMVTRAKKELFVVGGVKEPK
jgi:hypothetical protein